jgi:Arc/MetJ-type ribon-helix-helix transcriptional regulator
MTTLKVNFSIPEDVVRKLRNLVDDRKRSAFVAEALREKLGRIEEEKLKQELIEAYKERYEEDRELDREWEAITLENWPEWTKEE